MQVRENRADKHCLWGGYSSVKGRGTGQERQEFGGGGLWTWRETVIEKIEDIGVGCRYETDKAA